jgi:hypothetical protein
MASRAYAARRAGAKVREGLAMVGRSGLAIAYYPVLTGAFSMLAPFDAERGLRTSDGGFFTILPDLMVEEELIGAAQVYHELGCFGLSGGSGAGPWGGSVEHHRGRECFRRRKFTVQQGGSRQRRDDSAS